MKNSKNKQNNMIAGVVTACVLVIAAMMIVNITGNRADSLIGDENKTDVTVTAESKSNTTVEAVTRDSTSAADSIAELPKTQAEVSQASANVNIDTKPPVIEVTLAPVEVPDEKVIAILEEYDVQIVPSTGAAQTKPPANEQNPPNAVTIINGQKHIWHPDFGWCPDYGEGSVVIMDVESNGETYAGGW